MRSCGLQANAIAIITRCRCPARDLMGYCRNRSSGEGIRTSRNRRITCSLASARPARVMQPDRALRPGRPASWSDRGRRRGPERPSPSCRRAPAASPDPASRSALRRPADGAPTILPGGNGNQSHDRERRHAFARSRLAHHPDGPALHAKRYPRTAEPHPRRPVRLDGEELIGRPDREMRQVARRQDGDGLSGPLSCLDPTMTLGAQVAEPIRLHTRAGRAEAREQVIRLFRMSGSPPRSCGSGSIPMRSRRAAAARDDRDGVCLQPTASHRRRTDDRADVTVQAAGADPDGGRCSGRRAQASCSSLTIWAWWPRSATASW